MTDITTQVDQSAATKHVLTVDLPEVAYPGPGTPKRPVPTKYEVHFSADGETIDDKAITGWLHTGEWMLAHQLVAIYRDVAERLGLGVYEWDESTLGRNEVPPTFRRVDGVTMEALLPLDQIVHYNNSPVGDRPTPEQEAASRRACGL